MPALVVVTNESPNEHIALQTVTQLADFLLVVVLFCPFQSVNLYLVVEMACTKRGEETHQLDKRQVVLLCLNALIFFVVAPNENRQCLHA